ncbi:MAG: TIGR03545 family protein [Treponema sp.]|nr:TIGR03545 family protein [Treponema sp.]
MSMEKDEFLSHELQERSKTVEQDTSLEISEMEVPVPAEVELLPQQNKKGKKKKPPKTFPKKKLPKLLRKKYSQKKFERKLLKRIYIPRDREFIASYFMPVEGAKKPCVMIPDDRIFTKQELVRLKILSKEIRKQKGRVKLIPLVAVVSVIVVMVSAVLVFKDPLIKKGLQSAMETAFGAKVDIAYLHLGILDSNFTITGLEVANRNNTMKNLFEIGRLTVDFDLIELLKKRFVSDEMSVTDVRVNTDRKTDGALPEKPKKTPNPRIEQVKSQVTEFASAKTEVLKNSITDIFSDYNPETVLSNFYSKLSTPELVTEIEKDMQVLISSWKAVPDELKTSVNKVIADGQAVVNFDWNSIKSDPAQVRAILATLKSVTDNTTSLYKESEKTMNMLQRDVKQVQTMTNNVQKAITSDFNLISKEVNKITSFSIKDDGMNMLTASFEKIVADLFGKYYPVFQEALVYVQDLSAKSAAKKAAEAEKERTAIQRYAGRTIEYRKDNIPTFLIKKMHGSGADGNFSLSLDVTDISSDMTKWGKPASLSGMVGHGQMSDSFSGTLDLRDNRPGDLVELNYNGVGYPVDMTLSGDAAIPGVPTGKGIGAFSARITANETGKFSVGGVVNLEPVSFRTASFEPAYAYDLYSRALAMFTAVRAGVTLDYSPETKLSLSVDSDIDRRFMQVLNQLFNEELAKVKQQVTVTAQKVLDEGTAKVKERFGDFDDLKSLMDEQINRLESYKKELEKKYREGEERLKVLVEEAKNAANKAAQDVLKGANDVAQEALKGTTGVAQDVLKGVTDATQEALKGNTTAAQETLKGTTDTAQEALKGIADSAKDSTTKSAEDAVKEATNTLKGLFAR